MSAPVSRKLQEANLSRDHFELWAGRKLGVDLFHGVTDSATRRERLRTLLLERKLRGAVLCGPEPDAGPETWQSLFERVYGEELSG